MVAAAAATAPSLAASVVPEAPGLPAVVGDALPIIAEKIVGWELRRAGAAGVEAGMLAMPIVADANRRAGWSQILTNEGYSVVQDSYWSM